MYERRVLIVAENASVRFGGEAILPYHYFRLLLERGVDVHLIVHDRTRAELEQLFPSALERLHFVPDLLLQKLFFKLGRLLPRRVDEAIFGMANQFLTQWQQRTVLRALVMSRCIIHQPIPVSPRTPSLMFSLGAPVIIGPMNGGMEYPAAFRGSESLVSRVVVGLGRASSRFLNMLLPGKRDAAVLLVANERTRDALPTGMRGHIRLLPENGVDTRLWRAAESREVAGAKRFCFIGRLVDWKALDVAIEAVALMPGATLDVIGDGPMRVPWQALADRLKISDRICFLGWRSQRECAQHLSRCCALLLPSVYECGGAVVLEAMAMARPVIATAWGGPLDYLDASCGILIEPMIRDQMIADFASAMLRLAESPTLCARMGGAGEQRLLQHFDWNKKIDAILDVYSEVELLRSNVADP